MNEASERNPIDDVLAEYLRRIDHGEKVDPEQFIREHPELEDELRAFFADQKNIGRVLGTPTVPDDRLQTKADSHNKPVGDPDAITIDSSEAPGSSASDSTASFVRVVGDVLGGRFRILQFHAHGGLGKVSVAQDEEVDRKVALKELLDHRVSDAEASRRLLLEAEITGGLEHPGVVPVYGLGKRADGRPFYAMRFIRGTTFKTAIAEYHAQSQKAHAAHGDLELRRLLGHLIAVCQVMHYAHCRGILHCDLKPANVMLGKYGETLVVDWGLAQPADDPALVSGKEEVLRPRSAKGHSGRLPGTVSGTLAYMSPEQAYGDARLGPASDLFSLGAVLYYILTNQAPYQGKDRLELLRRVQHADFPPPRTVRRHIPPALQAICMKAMQREPHARYESARALADDLERWLADEAVSAHQESLGERLGRWTRRHRAWAQAGAISLILVSLIFAFATVLINRSLQLAVALAEENKELARREASAKEEAVTRFAEARRAVDTWLTGMSEALQYYPGMQQARLRLLHKAAEEYERFALQHSDNLDLELERGRSYLRLGDVRRQLNDTDGARKAYGRAQATLSDLSRRFPHSTESLIEWANSDVAAADALVSQRQTQEADALYCRVIQRLQAIPTSIGRRRPAMETLAQALNGHGAILIASGRQAEAEDSLRAARAVMNDLIIASADQPQDQLKLDSIQATLARLLTDTGRYEEALVVLDMQLAAVANLVAAAPDHPQYLETLASVRVHRATVLRSMGFYAKEIESYQAAIRDYENLGKALPDVPTHREGQALTRTDLAQALHQMRQNLPARTEAENAVALLDQLAAQFPAESRYTEWQAAARDILGQALLDLAKPNEALTLYEASLDAYERLATLNLEMPGYRERAAVARTHVARALHARGDLVRAKAAFERASRELEQLSNGSPDKVSYRNEKAHALVHYGTLLYETGDRPSARKAFDEASQIWRRLVDHSQALDDMYNLCWLWLTGPDESSRNPQAAIALAHQLLKKAPGNAIYLNAMGIAHYRNGQWAKAAETLQSAATARKAEHASDDFFLAMACCRLNQSAGALDHFRRASRWLETNCPGNRCMLAIQTEAKLLVDQTSRPPAKK